MARQPRIDLGNHVYHVLNRANERRQIFRDPEDYQKFEYLLKEMRDTYGVRILAYIIMPNHWHLLLYPLADGAMSKGLQWLTTTHARRHHIKYQSIGRGHLYQGRYKSFPVLDDRHALSVLKYIERNPVRAKLVREPGQWQWGSARRRVQGESFESEMPFDLPVDYANWILLPERSESLEKIRVSAQKGLPYVEAPGEDNIMQ